MRDEQIINDSAHDLSGVVLKDKFICHLVYEHDFIEHFNNMIACSFDWQEHVFIVYNKIAWDSSKRYNLKNSYYITRFDDDHVSFLLERSSQIVVHCLHTHDLTDYLYRNGHLLYKTNWLLWGADLYLYRCPGTDINPIENEAKRRCIIKRLGYITVSFKEEYDLAIQVYGGNAQYRFGFYPQPIDFPQYPPAPRKRRKRQTRNILVGNSGWPSNNHEQAFSVLSRFRDKDIRVFCPLSYGIPEYIEKVCAIGKETFGDKFIPLRKFIRPDRYLKLLNSMDLVVMNHDRQQAAGNIISSLFLRK
ncbi:MAG TPA: TDP-N-acetylfucosamine:lipid II N-acetylfucosaminyltransferase, partial [Deltaproteobacteria bacterium]|nr:TDP-N-acetylfucosamine:lipid II N-acetylfucosaminyltransferase [Deltaproteobacteria bacterium]